MPPSFSDSTLSGSERFPGSGWFDEILSRKLLAPDIPSVKKRSRPRQTPRTSKSRAKLHSLVCRSFSNTDALAFRIGYPSQLPRELVALLASGRSSQDFKNRDILQQIL